MTSTLDATIARHVREGLRPDDYDDALLLLLWPTAADAQPLLVVIADGLRQVRDGDCATLATTIGHLDVQEAFIVVPRTSGRLEASDRTLLDTLHKAARAVPITRIIAVGPAAHDAHSTSGAA